LGVIGPTSLSGLSVTSIAPTPDGFILEKRAAMIITEGKRSDRHAAKINEVKSIAKGVATVCLRSGNPQAVAISLAPALDPIPLEESAVVITTGCDTDHEPIAPHRILEVPAHLIRFVTDIVPGAGSQLSVLTVAPTDGVPFVCERARMIGAGDQIQYGSAIQIHGWKRAAHGSWSVPTVFTVAISQTAPKTSTPAFYVPVVE
jgi:hypothetical protein